MKKHKQPILKKGRYYTDGNRVVLCFHSAGLPVIDGWEIMAKEVSKRKLIKST